MLIDRLRRRFQRKLPAAAAMPAFSLPEDVAKLLAEKHCNKLTAFIEWACNQQGRDDILRELRSQVEAAGWEAGEITKLEAYQAYYCGHYQQAYDLAAPFFAENRFDPDGFGIASMALYNANQFDQAYALLREIKPHEHLLLENQDYQLAAASEHQQGIHTRRFHHGDRTMGSVPGIGRNV